MKQYYLLIFLFVYAFNFYGQAAIGVSIYSWPQVYSVSNWQNAPYQFTVKNIGTETLTNIYLTSQYNINFFGDPIASLAPGEESTTHFYGTEDFSSIFPYENMCYLERSVIVHATTPSNTQITDMSSPNGYYYSDNLLYFNIYSTDLSTAIDSQYLDGNVNGIVDFGDKIIYDYQIQGYLSGPNVELHGQVQDDPNQGVFFLTNGFNNFHFYGTGIQTDFIAYYNLSQADIESGFVYLNPQTTIYSSNSSNCYNSIQFYDPTPCADCPLPVDCSDCIITKLGNFESNRIIGKVAFNASDDNCTTGIGMANRKVVASSTAATFATFTNEIGNYKINTLVGVNSYSVTGNYGLNEDFTTNPNAITIATSGSNNSYIDSNFCISPTTDFADLNVSIIPITNARPGFDASYRLYYYNAGTTVLQGDLSFTYEAAKLGFIGSSDSVTQTLGLITFDYTNLIPFEQAYIDIHFNVLPPPIVNDGDVLTFLLTGNPIIDDLTPQNNIFSLNQIVTNSYDPNDKTVLEGAYISTEQALGYLNYVTRFQNTGSGEATTVVIKETLDVDLDWSTFEPLGGSHPYLVALNYGFDLTYTFPEIGLPGMLTNEPESHGWMAYRIKPKSNFTVEDIASSRSRIYFDFNPPIITNSVTTQIDLNLSSKSTENIQLSLAPNPATDSIFISHLDQNTRAFYTIFDNIGRIIVPQKKLENNAITIQSLESGMYFLSLQQDKKSFTLKFIKK